MNGLTGGVEIKVEMCYHPAMINTSKKYPDIPKKVFVEEFIKKSGANPVPNPSAIFMAGLPGAGKTEFSKNLVEIVGGAKAVRIDMDEIASQIKDYTPEKANEFREPATRLLNGILDRVLREKMEFVLDGTFGSRNAIKNIERAINHGYSAKIVYIVQDPRRAWDFTIAREKVEHRSITQDGFIDTYFNIIKNITEMSPLLKKYDKITLDIVWKNEKNLIESWSHNVKEGIDKLLETSYNNKTLKEYIND